MQTNRIEEIIEHLRGSCMSLREACDSFDIDSGELSQEDLEQIDDEIFCCTGCNWWYGVNVQSLKTDEPICEDCCEDSTEDED